ncbi:hypothetical protein [Nonomuraea sp. NEAU-A123]|uniref:hypothetical protein n=1 Tax=Nonomuraea sp. NEAU-A123 TaxID=2839649 RepID=UPI001BE45570|nr:hypothetical protein [Nonomuraea sp. NEAU-A123]MBT2226501.1 hypothetical protein [Nonomuraea sp. NEAU-A123]
MFKRRLAVLGAVGVLVLTALGGSAMADEVPSTAPGAKVTCTTSDGKSIAFARADAVGVPGEVSKAEAPEGIAVTRTEDGQVEIKEVPEGEVLEAVPAMPATPVEGEGFTTSGGEPTAAVKLERGTAQKAEDGSAPLEAITIKCESSK